ncbi:MAG: redox-regulated ATPase YchF [Sulfurospirillum sp.]|nr:redox-regulated ATPase YchF [Sulfurospirillum sp.]MBL0703701.1 redox-regulated ATPase YchF [Sulfurospirillum sp.]
MGLGVGIVGLPNIGKSTTFNALTKTQNAESANYPFCTIEPNKAVVRVPDYRLDELAKIVKPERILYSTVDFVDIAGLVKGASNGEGLGNKFLSNIREVEVILHLIRCFKDNNIAHVEGDIDPLRDIEIIESELIFADIQQLDKKIAKLYRTSKTDKKIKIAYEFALELKTHLDNIEPVSTFSQKDNPIFEDLDKELRFLSNKEIIYGANVDENSLIEKSEFVQKVEIHAKKVGAKVIVLCAKIEEELCELDEKEEQELLADLGIKESGLNQIIQTAFAKLNLISYFTAGVLEVRAWTIKKGWKAPKSASVIHNDFEKGFIRAEVIAYNDFISHAGENGAKDAGKMRLEGKDYIVKDGDVMHFRFNV